MPNLFDEIMKEEGISFEDLNFMEKKDYMEKFINIKNLTIPDIAESIINMKNTVAMELSNLQVLTDADKRKDDLLKARLQVYLLLEGFLTAPEITEKMLREAIKNLKDSKKG